LADRPTRVDIYENKSAARDAIKDNAKAISALAHRLYGEADRKLLIVLQGMDTSPTKHELAHDYLWRVHNVVPGKGQITVFNRSHYEDVLVVKVKNYVDAAGIEQRYDHINDFERLLTETGTTVLKFMLHISPETQGERLRHAPWHIIPSDSRKTRGAIISGIVRETLEKMNPQYPDPGYRPETFEIS